MNAPRLFALCAFAWLAGCGDTIHGAEYAEPAVREFRERMHQHQYEKIFDSSGDEFRAATPRAKGVALFEAVGRKLGELKNAKQINSGVNTNNGVTYATLVYDSTYDNGRATETFTVKIDDGKGVLVGYNISSLDMLIR